MSDIKMHGTMPTIQSAVKIGGDEMDGARIQLEIPGSDIAQVLKLLPFRGKLLEISFRLADG